MAEQGTVRLDPRNANAGTERGEYMVEHSLRTYGAGRSVLVDKHGTLIAGNKTFQKAHELGIPIQIVESDGQTLIAVKRTDLDLETDPAAMELGIADNRSSEAGLSWDTDVLVGLQDDGVDLSAFWYDDELTAMLEGIVETTGGLTDPDAVPEVPKEATTKPGDLWCLGRHRLMVGDSGDPEHIAKLMDGERGRLMATDPPYGVDFSGAKYNPRAKAWDGIEGDKRQGSELRGWLAGVIAVWLPHIDDDSAFYFWSAAMEEGSSAFGAIKDAGLHIQSQIIWVKNALVLGQADYQWRHENCWYAFKKGAHHRWLGGRAQTTVWEISKVANSEYVHPMQKPTELFAIPMRNHTAPGDVFLEPFSGSGSQFIAAEQEGRRCFGMELDPIHASTIVERWQNFTGKTAQLVTP